MLRPPVLTRRDLNRSFVAALLAVLAGRTQTMIAVAAPARVAVLDFAIAGGHYHGLGRVLASLAPGQTLRLRREPENPYDANAIAVHDSDGLKLGYLPRSANAPVAALMDSGTEVHADILRMISPERPADAEPFAFTGYAIGEPVIRLSIDPTAPVPAS